MSDKFPTDDEGLEPSEGQKKYNPEDFEEDNISDEQKYWRNLYEGDNQSSSRAKKTKKKSKFKDKEK